VFISDGSTDGTYEKIKEVCASDTCIKGAEFSRNFGKEAAIFAGLRLSTGDAVIVMDCDLQHPVSAIPEMIEKWKAGAEVVEGIKNSRGKESIFHKMSAGIFYGIMSALIKIDMSASSDFKLLDRKAVDELLKLPESNTFFRALSFWIGFKSDRVYYDVEERRSGKSKWSTRGLVSYAVKNATSFSTLPLKLITGMGWIFLVFALVLGVQTLVRFFMGDSADGFTTVILLLLIIGGFIMLSLGISGHYIARIYEEVKGRPRYIIRDTAGIMNKNITGGEKR
jgi:dolichol-phosphate mannosyltransferase